MSTTVPAVAGRREWIGLSVLALACLLYAMDLTVLHLAVPAISADLRPTSVQLLWIIDIYGFMVAGFLVTMGTLGDRIGRRKLLLAGGATFGLISLLAAFSPTPETLVASRALLGIAGATLAPSTLSLIFTMFRDLRQRSLAIGVWIGAFSAGGAVGPVLGGAMLERFWWGSVFLLAVPVMVLLLVLGPIVLPEYRDPRAGRLDLTSAVMSLAAVLAVIFGFKQAAQNGLGWLPVASIVTGVVIAGLFVRRQLRQPDPMIDVRLLRIRAFSASLLVNVVGLFIAFGYFLFVAQYLQLVLGLSPLPAGLWSLPSALSFVVGSQLGPRIVRVVRPAYLIGAGLAVAGVGLAMLTQVSAAGGLAVVVAASVVVSLGLAPVFGLTTEMVVGSAPPERAGAASGVSETGAELGGALGISVLGSVGVALYRSQMGTSLPAEVPPEAAAAARDTLGAAVDTAATLPGELGGEVITAAREAFVTGMHLTSTVSALAAVGVAILAVIALRHVPSGREEEAAAAAAAAAAEAAVAEAAVAGPPARLHPAAPDRDAGTRRPTSRQLTPAARGSGPTDRDPAAASRELVCTAH